MSKEKPLRINQQKPLRLTSELKGIYETYLPNAIRRACSEEIITTKQSVKFVCSLSKLYGEVYRLRDHNDHWAKRVSDAKMKNQKLTHELAMKKSEIENLEIDKTKMQSSLASAKSIIEEKASEIFELNKKLKAKDEAYLKEIRAARQGVTTITILFLIALAGMLFFMFS